MAWVGKKQLVNWWEESLGRNSADDIVCCRRWKYWWREWTGFLNKCERLKVRASVVQQVPDQNHTSSLSHTRIWTSAFRAHTLCFRMRTWGGAYDRQHTDWEHVAWMVIMQYLHITCFFVKTPYCVGLVQNVLVGVEDDDVGQANEVTFASFIATG